MLKKLRSPEEYETVLRSSLEEVDKMTRLVENLLMLASFESNKIMPERKALDLDLLMQGVINNIKKLAAQKEITIDLTGKKGTQVTGDEKQLKQLFLNLIDNAVKYTPDKGSVSVVIDEDGLNTVISIKDSGIGIPQGDIARIFDRFYRVRTLRSSHGFGLGLNIVKSIVDAHKGHIKVKSVMGKGTTFIISLPAH
jgi:signal transduction histidine kinase